MCVCVGANGGESSSLSSSSINQSINYGVTGSKPGGGGGVDLL